MDNSMTGQMVVSEWFGTLPPKGAPASRTIELSIEQEIILNLEKRIFFLERELAELKERQKANRETSTNSEPTGYCVGSGQV